MDLSWTAGLLFFDFRFRSWAFVKTSAWRGYQNSPSALSSVNVVYLECGRWRSTVCSPGGRCLYCGHDEVRKSRVRTDSQSVPNQLASGAWFS
jgi:hypothetical protein